MDDHEWMYTGRSSQGSMTDEWIAKTDAFLELVFARVKGARGTWCPCSICANTRRQTKVVMGMDENGTDIYSTVRSTEQI